MKVRFLFGLILGVLSSLAQFQSARCQIPDSLVPTLRWRRPAFRETRAISMDGKHVLFLGYRSFAVWSRSSGDIDREIPIAGGNVVDAAFEPGDTSIVALLTNVQLVRSASGGIAHLLTPINSAALFRYSIASGKRTEIAAFTTRSTEFHFSDEGQKLFEYANRYLRVFDARTGQVLDSCGSVLAPSYDKPVELFELYRPNPWRGVYPTEDSSYYVVYASADTLVVFQQHPLRELYSIPSVQSSHYWLSSFWISPDDHVRYATSDSLYDWDLTARSFGKSHPIRERRTLDHLIWKSQDTVIAIRIFQDNNYRRPILYDYGNIYDEPGEQPDDLLTMLDLKHDTMIELGPIAGLCDLQYKTSRFAIYSKHDAAYELLNLRTLRRDTLPGQIYTAYMLHPAVDDGGVIINDYSGSGIEFRASDGRFIRRYTDGIGSPANRSADGQFEFYHMWSGQAVLRNRRTGSIVKVWDSIPAGLEFSPNSKWVLVTNFADGVPHPLELHRLSDMSEVLYLPFAAKNMLLEFASDSKSIWASDLHTGLLEQWSIESKRIIFACHPDVEAVYRFTPSPDHRWLAAATQNWQLKLWDIRDTILRSIHRVGTIRCMRFTPNERYLLACSDSGVVLVDLMKDTVLGILPCMHFDIQDCLLRSDDFFTGEWGGEICAWNMPEAWVRPTSDPIRPKRSYLPLRFFIPANVREVLNNGKSYVPPRTDAKLEVLGSDHHLIVKLLETSLARNQWHCWDWDATGQTPGTYYMRTTLGGDVTESPLVLK